MEMPLYAHTDAYLRVNTQMILHIDYSFSSCNNSFQTSFSSTNGVNIYSLICLMSAIILYFHYLKPSDTFKSEIFEQFPIILMKHMENSPFQPIINESSHTPSRYPYYWRNIR